MHLNVRRAVHCLNKGGIVAYPTEAVWGLGCDPANQQACLDLLQIKERPVEKGMILVAADEAQLEFLLAPLGPHQRQQLRDTWPGPVTWLVPDPQLQVPWWIRGEHASVAVRVSAHPLVRQLCNSFGGPIISTSANKAGQLPARTRLTVMRTLGTELDYVLPGSLGRESAPSRIIDLASGQQFR